MALREESSRIVAFLNGRCKQKTEGVDRELIRTLQELSQKIESEDFISAFIEEGGLDVLFALLPISSESIQHAILKRLHTMLCNLKSLESCTKLNNVEQLLALINTDCDPPILAFGLRVLTILSDYSTEAFSTCAHAVQAQLKSGKSLWARLAQIFRSEHFLCWQAALQLLLRYAAKAFARGDSTQFIQQLRDASLDASIATMVDSEEPITAGLARRVRQLVFPQQPSGSLELSKLKTDILDSELENAASQNLGSRAEALSQTAGLANVPEDSQWEAKVLEALQSHLEQLAEQKAEQAEAERRTNEREKLLEALQRQQEELKKELEAQRKELQARDADSAQLKEELRQATGQQEALMERLQASNELVLEQRHIAQQAEMALFYQTVQMKLNQILLASKLVASGVIPNKSKTMIQKGMELAGDLVPFPGAKTAALILSKGIGFYQQRRYKAKEERKAQLTVTVSAMEALTEEVARRLAFTYEEQLGFLTREGSRMLAECSVHRLTTALDSLGQGEGAVGGDVAVELLRAVTIASPASIISFTMAKRLQTKGGDSKWTGAVLHEAAIRTPDGRYFVGGNARPEKYGYRLGSEEEAKQLGFKESRERVASAVPAAPAGGARRLPSKTAPGDLASLRGGSVAPTALERRVDELERQLVEQSVQLRDLAQVVKRQEQELSELRKQKAQ